MPGRGNLFSQDYSIGESSETSFSQKHTLEEKGKGYLYPIDNEVVDDIRRISRVYAKKILGLPIIPALPRREFHKKYCPQLENSVLVEDLEELVETTLEEVVQPMNQLGPDSPHYSPFRMLVHSPPQSPIKIMANVNANQPAPPPSWRARSPLNITPPLHAMP